MGIAARWHFRRLRRFHLVRLAYLLLGSPAQEFRGLYLVLGGFDYGRLCCAFRLRFVVIGFASSLLLADRQDTCPLTVVEFFI